MAPPLLRRRSRNLAPGQDNAVVLAKMNVENIKHDAMRNVLASRFSNHLESVNFKLW